MFRITVRHSTIYRYRQPVILGEHRMIYRPRDSHDLRLVTTRLVIDPPPAELRWLHDPYDNSVAVATFAGTTSRLCVESTLVLEHYENSVPEHLIEDHARSYPFRYSDDNVQDLARALAHHYPASRVSTWAAGFLAPARSTDTMQLLRAITHGIQQRFTYLPRVEEGVWSPEQTLSAQGGSCRDLAVLMMEGVRSLGIAARFVSGYLLSPDGGGMVGSGSTHAWMQAYLPGAGWIDFDPTNGMVGNRYLIRVAVAWTPEHVLPLMGSYQGASGVCLGMDVAVTVTDSGTR